MQVYDWQDIVRVHGPAVWQTAYRLLGNRSDTADCFQETFLAALEVSRRQPVRGIRGLLLRLATTRAIDRLREKTRHERHQADGAAPRVSACCHDADPAGQAEAQELAARLREAIGLLPPQEARAFCLRYFSEMSYRQIAKELNIRTSAAGVLLHRAKIRLRGAMNAEQCEMDEVLP